MERIQKRPAVRLSEQWDEPVVGQTKAWCTLFGFT